MSSSRPYLLRALLDWILDNNGTPQIVVDSTCADAMVPSEYARDGQIVLNVHPDAVQAFELTNESVSFSARFQGQPRDVYVPMRAVNAIFARENGDGMAFAPDAALSSSNPSAEEAGPKGADTEASATATASAARRPSLKVVK